MSFLAKLLTPFLDWVQVEVTTCCTAKCFYCPHTIFQKSWKTEHMSLQTFERLLPVFRRSNLVYLQGWGEPLTHPRFFDMVHLAKKQCHRIGTTTNGMLCDRQTASRMVREGLFVVCFSLAGTGPFQDTLRQGTSLQTVLQAITFLDNEKKRLGGSLPKIHVAYIWLQSHRDAVKDLPDILVNSGVSQVVVTTLDLVPHSDLAGELIQAQSQEERDFLHHLAAEVTTRGATNGLDIHFHLASPNFLPGTCTENVTKSCVISADGWVSPCVFKNLPVEADKLPMDKDLKFPGHMRLGNITEQSFNEIWRQPVYRTFRKNHAQGRVPAQCAGCRKLNWL